MKGASKVGIGTGNIERGETKAERIATLKHPMKGMTESTDAGEEGRESLVVMRSLPTIVDPKRNEAKARAASSAQPPTLMIQNLNQMTTFPALTAGV